MFELPAPPAGASSSARILVVDDDPLSRDLLTRRLGRRGYVVETASSAKEAMARLEHPPALVISDISMPEVSGLDLLEWIRAHEEIATLPVIMMSALRESADIVGALEKGANDYITRPIDLPVLVARMETHLRQAALMRRLETQNQLLADLAAVDELTGVYNRRALEQMLDTEFHRMARSGAPLSALMLDVDHFKRVNDTHGHGVGDLVLRELAARCQTVLRASDLLCRYGGEEFCVLLPETDAEAAPHVGRRLVSAVSEAPFRFEGLQLDITVSVGVASTTRGDGMTPRDLFDAADKALYAAKRGGRNRVWGMRPQTGELALIFAA